MPGSPPVVVRPGNLEDLPVLAEIQAESPEASQWEVSEYTRYHLWVAVLDRVLAGYLVARHVAPDEYELLNLAVTPRCRRQGVARALIAALRDTSPGTIFLEVRASNTAARNLYKSMGFQEVSMRQEYYDQPLEAAIVMKFHSC